MQSNKNSGKGCILLFLTALIWGAAFVAQSKGMEFMSPFTFNGVRTVLGALVLVPFICVRRNLEKKKGTYKPATKKTYIGGFFCGVVLCAATNVQQFGILYTSAGKAGFITTLYIILVPILGLILGKKVRFITWPCVLLAIVGMYFLCVQGEKGINFGDILIFICAILFAVHILTVDHFVESVDGVMLSFIQFVVAGVLSVILAFIFEAPTLSGIIGGGTSILYAGVMSTGVAYTLQIVGQKYVAPTTSAMITSLESVFCSVFCYLALILGILPNEKALTPVQVLGCVIVFAAVIIVQLPERKPKQC